LAGAFDLNLFLDLLRKAATMLKSTENIEFTAAFLGILNMSLLRGMAEKLANSEFSASFGNRAANEVICYFFLFPKKRS
jgi:hypothetical protein